MSRVVERAARQGTGPRAKGSKAWQGTQSKGQQGKARGANPEERSARVALTQASTTL